MPRSAAIIISLIFTFGFLFLLYQEWALHRYMRASAGMFRVVAYIALGIPLVIRQVRMLLIDAPQRELFGWDYAMAVMWFIAGWVFLVCLIIGNHLIKGYWDGVADEITEQGRVR